MLSLRAELPVRPTEFRTPYSPKDDTPMLTSSPMSSHEAMRSSAEMEMPGENDDDDGDDVFDVDNDNNDDDDENREANENISLNDDDADDVNDNEDEWTDATEGVANDSDGDDPDDAAALNFAEDIFDRDTRNVSRAIDTGSSSATMLLVMPLVSEDRMVDMFVDVEVEAVIDGDDDDVWSVDMVMLDGLCAFVMSAFIVLNKEVVTAGETYVLSLSAPTSEEVTSSNDAKAEAGSSERGAEDSC